MVQSYVMAATPLQRTVKIHKKRAVPCVRHSPQNYDARERLFRYFDCDALAAEIAADDVDAWRELRQVEAVGSGKAAHYLS